MTEELIEARKQFGQILSQSRSRAKPQRCLWCGKAISRFCDSHTIPKMILKNIETGGKLDYANTIIENPLNRIEQGIAEADVFHLLCKECDNSLFQEYENPENLKNIPTSRMLALIALKNLFYLISKRLTEIELYNHEQVKNQMPGNANNIRQTINALDKRDFFFELDRIRDMLVRDEYQFEIISWERVDYKVPVAFQGALTVYGDMQGEKIIDIYDHSADTKIKQMHSCVFPLDDCSVIFTFYNREDTEYEHFASQLRNMEQEKRLKFLGYFIFFMSEDMMLAKKFPHRTYFYEQVRKMFMDNYEFLTSSKEEFIRLAERNLTRFKYWKEDIFPAILTQRYAIQVH